MHTSLTILIILTVVVLVVILMTSPTCKNAVGAMLGNKKTNVNAKRVQGAPSVQSLPKPRSGDMKNASQAMSMGMAGRLPVESHVLVPPNFPIGPLHMPSEPKPDLPAWMPFGTAPQQQPAPPQKSRTVMPRNMPQVQPKQKPVSTEPVSQNPSVKVEVKSDPRYPVLSGNVLEMFNSTLDTESEFGLTEAQIDELAREYKATHLDIKKDPVTRHRSLIRSQLDEADAKLRDGFQANLNGGKKANTEETIISMREERLSKGENLTEKKKKTSKMSFSSRK